MARRLIIQWISHSRNTFLREHTRLISFSNVMNKTDRRRKVELMIKDRYFDQEVKDKQTFLDLIQIFKNKNYKTGQIEFIYAALNRMKEFGVHEDLETYKSLIDVMPKGKMVSRGMFGSEFMYYPKHQHCITDVLSKMEENRVMPSKEMREMIDTIFGRRSLPMYKLLRMLYWMPKLKYASPWPAPEPRPTNPIEVAKLAVKRMVSVDLENEVTVFHTKDDKLSSEDTWIVSSQSPTQKKLLHYHPENQAIFVEGGFKMYLGRKDIVSYFILRADLPTNRRRKTFKDPDVIKNLKIPFFDPPTVEDIIPDFSVHEQKDGIIYAIGITGSTSKDSLFSWIRLLELNGNPKLNRIPIVFRDSSPVGKVEPFEKIVSVDESFTHKKDSR